MTGNKLPWEHKRIIGDGGSILNCITLQSKGDPLLDVIAVVSKPNAEANAAFIVKAANCHDKLVEMVKKMEVVLRKYDINTPRTRKIMREEAQALLNSIEGGSR